TESCEYGYEVDFRPGAALGESLRRGCPRQPCQAGGELHGRAPRTVRGAVAGGSLQLPFFFRADALNLDMANHVLCSLSLSQTLRFPTSYVSRHPLSPDSRRDGGATLAITSRLQFEHF